MAAAQSGGIVSSCGDGQRASQGAKHTLQEEVSTGSQIRHHALQALAERVLESQVWYSVTSEAKGKLQWKAYL